MPSIELPQGTLDVIDVGDGPPLVFLHGYLMAGDLWGAVIDELSDRFRCIAPTLPLGGHATPLHHPADASPLGVVRMVADLAETLDLRDATLIGSDTGGALAQLVVTRYPERIGRLVLTNCDCYDNFPPSYFKALRIVARVPGALRALLATLRIGAVRRSPLGFGVLSHRGVDDLAATWVVPSRRDAGVRRDLEQFTLGLDPALTVRAGEELRRFAEPSLIVWAPEDRLFPVAHAEQLAATMPDCRLERLGDSLTLTMVDQPRRLAEHIATFVEATSPSLVDRGGVRSAV